MERLQKHIARGGICSRRKAEELILAGKVEVNGEVVTELGTKVSGNDLVTVDGVVVDIKDYQYLVMNKPRGVISSVNDEAGRKTVISILPEQLKKYRLFPIGRLDYDTKGVLLLTNDGEFMNQLVGPQSQVEKEYLARVDGIITKEKLMEMNRGVDIGGYVTRRCKSYISSVDVKNNSSLVGIILKEGKKHQVKLMLEAIGFPVKHLTRIRFGELTTEGIPEGGVRYLTPYEIKRLNILSHKQ